MLSLVFKQKERGLMCHRDWEVAHREGRKVFFEAGTMTLRQCPENYCLAIHQGYPSRWVAAVDKAALVTEANVQRVLNKWAEGLRGGAAIARAVELELFR